MDGTVLDTKFGDGPEPALFANCVDITVKEMGTCGRSPSPSRSGGG